jgi:hypothetical protein
MLAQKLFKWLMVLFVGELPIETEYLVWDLFFVKGSVVIFRVALTILQMMQDEIIADDSYDNVMIVISSFASKVTRKDLLKNLS